MSSVQIVIELDRICFEQELIYMLDKIIVLENLVW